MTLSSLNSLKKISKVSLYNRKGKRAISDTPCIHIRVQSTIVAYIRGLFSWLFGGWEVMERLGRHRASLAKPYLVMAVQKFALDWLQFLRIRSHVSTRSRNPKASNQLRHRLNARADIPLSLRSAIMIPIIIRTVAIHLLSAWTIIRRVFSMHFRRILRNDMIELSLWAACISMADYWRNNFERE